MKTCFKCGAEKPLTEFYKHPAMADGRVNKCKECNKKYVRENRSDKVEYYREYDRERGNRQDASYLSDYRAEYPNKYAAHAMVGTAIKSGKLEKKPCELCGTSNAVHAHHDDYLKPLDVRWLCASHHRQWHINNGQALNAK